MLPSSGVLVQGVAEGSIAQEVGIRTGDRVLTVGGQAIEDELDYMFQVSQFETELTMRVAKASGELWEIEIEKNPEESLGLELEGIQTRLCTNNCIFCFVHQLPR